MTETHYEHYDECPFPNCKLDFVKTMVTKRALLITITAILIPIGLPAYYVAANMWRDSSVTQQSMGQFINRIEAVSREGQVRENRLIRLEQQYIGLQDDITDLKQSQKDGTKAILDAIKKRRGDEQ